MLAHATCIYMDAYGLHKMVCSLVGGLIRCGACFLPNKQERIPAERRQPSIGTSGRRRSAELSLRFQRSEFSPPTSTFLLARVRCVHIDERVQTNSHAYQVTHVHMRAWKQTLAETRTYHGHGE